MIKKLIISDTQSSKTQIFANVQATTLAGLKSELPEVNFEGKSIVERDSRATYELEDSKLPNQDTVVLFLSTINVKAGADINNMSREELYELARDYKDDNSSLAKYSSMKTADLRATLRDILEDSSEFNESLLTQKLDEIIANAQFIKENMSTATQVEIDSFMEAIKAEGAQIQAAMSKVRK